jgi:hypothetical protein
VRETEFAVSSSSAHRVFILSLEDPGMMHDRVTGTFFAKKNTITTNIYLDGLKVYVLLLIYDTERKEGGEIYLRRTSDVRCKTFRTHDFLNGALKGAGKLPNQWTYRVGPTS